MARDDEVVPDSQDEAELSVRHERDSSPPLQQPLTNASLPSSASFVLPRPMPRPTAPSTISEFTPTTAAAAAPSAISAFPSFTSSSSSSSSSSAARPRPKPRPAYAGAKQSIAPTVVRTLYALPPPQVTYSADISERIKARRASQKAASEAVIDISSDTSPPRRGPQSPDLLNLSAPTHVSPSVRSLVPSARELSPLSPLKRKHVDADALGPPALPPKRKKKSKVADETGSPQEKKKKSQERKKAPAKSKPKPKEKEKEKEQFKSSEFIVDSDDEVGLGATSGVKSGLPASATVTAAALVKDEDAVVSSERYVLKPENQATREDAASENPAAEKPAKNTTNKKRKKTEKTQDQGPADAVDAQPPPKKAKRSANAKLVNAKPAESVPASAPGKNDVIEPSPDVSDDEERLSYPKRKKAGRVIIEDEDRDDAVGEKENVVPATPNSLKLQAPVSLPSNKPPLASASKPSYAHPPKNRPLSSILQRVNGASPRPRSSPSVSRTLLSRIAPLHPNRRTPPPPPPPRIIPKKTKKELEREEKWEEELQEAVVGWCELGEEEREKMRRAKRDWELGLCEE